jgi:UDP-glucose:(heptosyl)LPS alpha-1,3-glucosyltransferase
VARAGLGDPNTSGKSPVKASHRNSFCCWTNEASGVPLACGQIAGVLVIAERVVEIAAQRISSPVTAAIRPDVLGGLFSGTLIRLCSYQTDGVLARAKAASGLLPRLPERIVRIESCLRDGFDRLQANAADTGKSGETQAEVLRIATGGAYRRAERMKLGFLLFDYFPFGGLQRDCLKIASICAGRGHDIAIFTRTWQGGPPNGISVELFGRHGFTNTGRNRRWVAQLNSALPQRGLDGVIGFDKLPGLDVYFGAAPCYVARMARMKPDWYRWLPRYRHFKRLEEGVFRRGAKTELLLLTTHEIPIYQELYETESERFHVLPPGIERRAYSEDQRLAIRRRLRAEHGWAEEDRLLLLVGSGFRVKGLDRAIAALSALPDGLRKRTRLVVIGQNRSTEFAIQARRLGVGSQVHFLGGRHDVPDWLLAADLCVHPAYSESAGMILLEAMTAALPVLTTDTCGYAFHVKNAGAGTVLPSPFSQDQCNRALAEMIDSTQRAEWRVNGLAYAAREDLYSCHARATDIIEATIRRKQTA